MALPPAPSNRRRRQHWEPSNPPALLTAHAHAPAFDKDAGEFSGWLHVADVTQRRGRWRRSTEFRRYFCRLRELECAFYASADGTEQPLAAHVVVAVTRVHERNKALLLTDHADRRLLLHTPLGADFEQWLDAFAGAVRRTHVTKSPIDAQETQRREFELHIRHWRAPTVASDAPSDDLDERARDVWLYVHSPWWALWRRRARRYLVLSGVTLSCFRVNKEGYVADFVVRLATCAVDRTQRPLEVCVTSESGKLLRLSASPTACRRLELWVAHLESVLLATRRAYSEAELAEQQAPPILGGFV